MVVIFPPVSVFGVWTSRVARIPESSATVVMIVGAVQFRVTSKVYVPVTSTSGSTDTVWVSAQELLLASTRAMVRVGFERGVEVANDPGYESADPDQKTSTVAVSPFWYEV